MKEKKFEKSPHQQRVEEFMLKIGCDLPDKPTIPDEKIRILCAKLILEEAMETIDALGVEFGVGIGGGGISLPSKFYHFNFQINPYKSCNLEEIADGCLDTRVVSTYTLSACGIPDEEVQLEVDNNNLAKFGPGHYIREDGKLIKPPDHKPPNLKSIIEGCS